MKRFSMFRRLRCQTLKRPAAGKDKPTKGAGRLRVALVLLAVMVLLVAATTHAQDESGVLYPGTYQAEDARVRLLGASKIMDASGAEGDKSAQTEGAVFTISGTDVIVRVKGQSYAIPDGSDGLFLGDAERYEDYLQVCRETLDACPLRKNAIYLGNVWNSVTVRSSLLSTTQKISIIRFPSGDIQIDSITVLDRTFENLFPYLAAIGITLGMTLFVVGSALRERWRK